MRIFGRQLSRFESFMVVMVGIVAPLVAVIQLTSAPSPGSNGSDPIQANQRASDSSPSEPVQLSMREQHEATASNVDDVIRTMGYEAHIFPSSNAEDLMVISKTLSKGQDRELFLSLLRGRWKAELCNAGYNEVLFKTGLLSTESIYPLFC